MKSPQHQLSQRIEAALGKVAPDTPVPGDLAVPAQDPRFGDYQCNVAMGLARTLKSNPRTLATELLGALDVGDMADPPTVAGPGFINLKLTPAWLGDSLTAIARSGDERLGVDPVERPETIVVDFSSPNVAKSLHIGHVRSTVIGDAINRMLRFQGHRVIADNHLGDWGTAFGKLIVGYREELDAEAFKTHPLQELERVYRVTTAREKDDPALQGRVRAELARMQAGDEENLSLWRRFMEISRTAYEPLYQRLGVRFDLWHGESFYNPMLADTIASLQQAGIAREDQGAVVIFYDDAALADKPLIIRKSDGAALYATTDLAGVRYRVETYHPSRIIILTDGRQQLHFQQVFTAARRWGYTDVDLIHVWFGSILGANGKAIKTRDGDDVKLDAVLDEAEERALAVVRDNDKNSAMSDGQAREIARVVGIGAVKYADLSQNRTSDYVFNWDKMLAMNGNTAPYLQYAFARIHSMFRKGQVDADALQGPIRLEAEAERTLGLHILRFGEAVVNALDGYRPNVMTSYLYDLAGAFSSFYESCPVLTVEEPRRTSRLTLCRLTAMALHQGLGLLGIETLPQM